jgi:hypothetical protein
VWHVDDIKMSHADEKEVSKLITWLKSVYGEDMRVSRGKVNDYLGMTLDFTNKGEVKVTMIDYLKGVINDFPEIITGTAITPATANLFDMRPEDDPPLRSPAPIRYNAGKKRHSAHRRFPYNEGQVTR